jgi:hypothetical protein
MAQDNNIPGNDAQFEIFQKQFVAGTTKTPVQYGITATDVTALTAGQTAWQTAYAAHIAAQQGAVSATQTKDEARATFEIALRVAAQKVHVTAGSDNSLRAVVGLPPRAVVRAAVGTPRTRPIGRLEVTGPRTLVVHCSDELTPARYRKPQGVRGCEIYVFVGDQPPPDPAGYRFLALVTRTSYTHEHPPADAGKTATYLFRWQNTKGETGPFSRAVTAKIPL